MFLNTQENYSLLSIDTPLISNLNIVENIALVKEVHTHTPIIEAEALAHQALSHIHLSHIGLYEVSQCTQVEIFYVMLIRAVMSSPPDIILKMPNSILHNIGEMHHVLSIMDTLKKDKNILILDIIDNEIYYEGLACNIIK